MEARAKACDAEAGEVYRVNGVKNVVLVQNKGQNLCCMDSEFAD